MIPLLPYSVRQRAAAFIHLLPAVILYLILRDLEHWTAGDPFWAEFLTWRLPLLLGSSGFLIHTISSGLPRNQRSRILVMDGLLWITAPLGIIIHCCAPGWAHPDLPFSVVYLGTFTMKAALIGGILMLKQSRAAVSTHLVFIVALWFFSAHAVWQSSVHTISGDEPHYLMMTHSLVNDADLNLFNDYREKAYAAFYPGELEPKPSDMVSKGQIYSRGLGATFPALLIPAFVIGGHAGVQGFIAVCAALLISQLYALLIHRRLHPRPVLMTVILIGSSMPVLTYASLIYPDIPAALLIIAGLRLLQIRPLSKTGRSVPAWMLVLCVALIFLKFRYFVPVALLLVPVMTREHRKRGRLLWFLFSLVIFCAAYLVVDRAFLGGDLFANRFGGIYQVQKYLPNIHSFGVLPGLLFDQESGLLFYAPVYFLLFAGWQAFKGRKDSLYWFALLAPLFTILSLSGHFAWHCLPTPPLRYLLPVLPPTGIFLVYALSDWRRKPLVYRFVATVCIGTGWAVGLITSAAPDLLVNLADGSAKIFEQLGRILHQPLPVYFPSIIRPGTALAGWSVFIVLLITFLWTGSRRKALVQPSLNPPAGILTMLILGICVPWISGTSGVCKYHPEDQWWVTSSSGTYFPVNRDPFFHQEKAYGWQFMPGTRVLTPLQAGAGTFSIVVRCRLTDSKQEQKLMIRIDDEVAGVLAVSSFDWKDYAFRLPEITPGSRITMEAPAANPNVLAVDFIRLHKVTDSRFDAWRFIAGITRRLGWNRITMACMSRAFLSSPGEPWFEMRSLLPGAKPPAPESARRHPIDAAFLNRMIEDARTLSMSDLHTLEFVLGMPLIKVIDAMDPWEYAASGIAQGWLPAARLAMQNRLKDSDIPEHQLLRVASYYLMGSPEGAARELDTILVTGSMYPMRLSNPSISLPPTHPVQSIFQDMETRPSYINAAFLATNRHLVDAVRSYHQSDYRAAGAYFDAYYLSDYRLFLDTVPDLTPDLCVKTFRYANRIHAQHVEEIVDVSLEKERPLTALAAANYGYRMFPNRKDIVYGRARALFHMQRYTQARKVCLEFVARFHDDDRGRWLIEQIMHQTRQKSLRLGSLKRGDEDAG